MSSGVKAKMAAQHADPVDVRGGNHWLRNRRLTAVLLLFWLSMTLSLPYFARELNGDVLGWPFSVWFAGEGAPLIYVLIVASYARSMNRCDREHGLDEPD